MVMLSGQAVLFKVLYLLGIVVELALQLGDGLGRLLVLLLKDALDALHLLLVRAAPGQLQILVDIL